MPMFFRPATASLDRWDFWITGPTVAETVFQSHCSLSELHDRQNEWSDIPHILLIPVELVFCTTLTLTPQQYRQGRLGIPYMIEDWVSVDIEKLHVVVGTRDRQGQVAVLAIERDVLERMLEALAASRIVPERALTDAHLLPEPEAGQALFWQDQGRYLIRLPGQAVAGCSEQTLEFVQRHCVENGLEPVRQEADWPSQLQSLTLSALQRQGVDFLQGSFKVQKNHWKIDGTTQAVLALVAAAVFVTTLNYFSAILQERTATHQLLQATTQAYQQIFPDEQKIVNLRLQMQSHLDALNGQHSGLLPVLAELADSSRRAGIPVPTHLNYQAASGLDIEVTAEAEVVNRWIKMMQNAGLQSRLLSASGLVEHVQVGVP